MSMKSRVSLENLLYKYDDEIISLSKFFSRKFCLSTIDGSSIDPRQRPVSASLSWSACWCSPAASDSWRRSSRSADSRQVSPIWSRGYSNVTLCALYFTSGQSNVFLTMVSGGVRDLNPPIGSLGQPVTNWRKALCSSSLYSDMIRKRCLMLSLSTL